jgi:2-polyprenyl-3-methyl-5-hydroxy-6-metoxy-1,4-benzoquinol methylase
MKKIDDFDLKLNCCPMCEAIEIKKFMNYFHFKKLVYFKCGSCDLVFQNPTFSKIKWYKFYLEDYRQLYESHKEPTDFVLKRQNERANVYSNFIFETIGNIKIENHLDIGSSAGVFLKKIKDKFQIVNSIGIEPGIDYSKIALKNFVIYNSIEEVLETNLKFDLISLCHVLEHIPSPKDFMIKASSLLNENGLLFIEVPNMGSRITSFEIAHPICLNLYSLNSLLEGIGFEIKKYWLHGQPSEPNLKSEKYLAVIAVKKNFTNHNKTNEFKKLSMNKLVWDSYNSSTLWKHIIKFIYFRILSFFGSTQSK